MAAAEAGVVFHSATAGAASPRGGAECGRAFTSSGGVDARWRARAGWADPPRDTGPRVRTTVGASITAAATAAYAEQSSGVDQCRDGSHPMAVSRITEVRNATGFQVIATNFENRKDTDGAAGVFAPGEARVLPVT